MAEYTRNISFATVNTRILAGTRPPGIFYYLFMLMLASVIGWAIFSWVYQSKVGMGVAGISHPVGWGVYIANFVFWVGIAHSGTLISAILYLVRSKWRDAVSRSTEAMTVFAVTTAGLFPLIHLGRIWAFYYILPYPNHRDLYPNFMSPLVLDLLAIITYLSVSVIFFYFGLIPDSAAARDRFRRELGTDHWKYKFYNLISLGWSGNLEQWRHYNRSYLYFAMLATPLVISVHSIVSWDFANSLLPGWHSTLFAPYFVAGAIHSGLAMSLTLLIPLRMLLNLEELITRKHLMAIANLMILTTLILAYSYVIEPFIEFYSGNVFHVQFATWRLTGSISWIYYMVIVFNVAVPLSFLFGKPRNSIKWLFVASILVNIGMWFERYMIVIGATAHDFMPHNWGDYGPTWVELSITAGSFAFFFFLFLLFARLLPTVPIADFKDYLLRERLSTTEPVTERVKKLPVDKTGEQRLFVFPTASVLVEAVKMLTGKGFHRLETFTPTKVDAIEEIMGVEKSPVSYWTVAGGLLGMAAALYMTIGSVNIYDLIVGGKLPVSLIPFVLVVFELTVLFAAVANLVASLVYSGLYKRQIHPWYTEEFSTGSYGLLVNFDKKDESSLEKILKPLKPREKKRNG